MRKPLYSIVIFCSYFTQIAFQGKSAVTYSLDKTHGYTARLGDNLVRYAHARWIAYKLDIPLIYKPFEYSEDLALSSMHIKGGHKKQFDRHIELYRPSDVLRIQRERNILYVVPTFFLEIQGYDAGRWSSFKIDWDDQEFLALLKEEIKPKVQLKLVSIPKGKVSIAMHVRKGGGYDRVCQERTIKQPCADKWRPLRFPPDSYYSEQLKKIVNIIGSVPIYVHIFTDDPDPAVLAKKFEAALKNPHVQFGFRASGNHHAQNVLEDLFSMAQFDYLIRSESFFSFVASKLGNFKLVIKPHHSHWKGKELVIDAVKIERKA